MILIAWQRASEMVRDLIEAPVKSEAGIVILTPRDIRRIATEVQRLRDVILDYGDRNVIEAARHKGLLP